MIAMGLFLMYGAPLAQQRRIFEAATILPMAIGASYGMAGFFEALVRWRKRSESLLHSTVVAGAISLVFFGLFAGPAAASWRKFRAEYDGGITRTDGSFLPNGNIEAMRWLSSHTKKGDVILSSMINGKVLPTYANRSVFIGHWPLTMEFERKSKQAIAFFEGRDTQEKMVEFLKKEKINYVFYSFYEKIPGTFSPEAYPFLKSVYRNRDATLYKVL